MAANYDYFVTTKDGEFSGFVRLRDCPTPMMAARLNLLPRDGETAYKRAMREKKRTDKDNEEMRLRFEFSECLLSLYPWDIECTQIMPPKEGRVFDMVFKWEILQRGYGKRD